jgi:hypothetical protein
VQVSRQELLAARVIELGLARLLQENRSSVIFAHHSPAALQTFAIASRPNGFVAQNRSSTPLVFFAPSGPQCSSRKGGRFTQATNRWTPQCNMDASSRDKGSSSAIGHNSRH